MANPFVHVELNTTDVAKAKSFYSGLFNWKLKDMPMSEGSYTIEVGEGTGGGLMKHPIPGASSAWLAYVLVDDVKNATGKAKALGATIFKDVTEVPGMGWFSLIMDPTGAASACGKPRVIRNSSASPWAVGRSGHHGHLFHVKYLLPG